jgi:hypothetical protein
VIWIFWRSPDTYEVDSIMIQKRIFLTENGKTAVGGNIALPLHTVIHCLIVIRVEQQVFSKSSERGHKEYQSHAQ